MERSYGQEEKGLTAKQAKRYAVIARVLAGGITQGQAALELGLSRRQIIRLCQRVKGQGIQGLISKRQGRPSHKAIAQGEQARYIDIIKAQYEDFGPTLAHEYLSKEHGYSHSRESLRKAMIGSGLWSVKARRTPAPHPLRQRRAQRGELVQIDGSHHDWFEGRAGKCCLIAFIDDASSQILAARFSQEESTADYFALLGEHITAHGLPQALYSDRAAVFTKSDPEDSAATQFERALMQLGIEPVCAHSPQAKGRVERLFKTLQDRLCKAMRLGDITGIEAANSYIASYIAQHNAAFAVPARDSQDAHSACQHDPQELARILAHHHHRVLNANQSCSFEGSILQVKAGQAHAPKLCKGQSTQVGIVKYASGQLEIVYRGKVLAHQHFALHEHLLRKRSISAKALNGHMDTLAQQRKIAKSIAQVEHQQAQRSQGIYTL